MALTALILGTIMTTNQSNSDPARALDFWVGEWECVGRSRTKPGEDEWSETKCTNSIRSTLGGKVIEENFAMEGFSGRSWSVYNAPKGLWQQTWVDDSGSYLLFEGKISGDARELRLINASPGTDMRMIWEDISHDGFWWRWQRSTDSGATWETQWELRYTRKT
ncbi:MAG: DUF1579 family protein [Fimbriimonadaceae bacterium]|nr:DUF1579 family protein [Fimbriimonadaceae bacterium]